MPLPKRNPSPPKAKTKLFRVNLQEGFIVDDKDNTIYADYNNLHAVIITVAPWSQWDFNIPDELRHYTISNRLVGGFSISGWTNQGHKSITTLGRRITTQKMLAEKH